jgi:hypothetical protein
MSGRGPSHNRTGELLPGSALRGGILWPRRDEGRIGCFTTLTTMRWLPAALREGGLVRSS